MYWGFSFKRGDTGLYLRHDSSVPVGQLYVPKHVGPDKISMICNTKPKRNKKGPVSLALMAFPSYQCTERDRYLLRLHTDLTMVPVDEGDALLIDDPAIDELVHIFDKDCFEEFGMRFDAPSVDREYLQKRIGFVFAPTPMHCIEHDGRLDPTGVGLTEIWKTE